MSWRLIILVMTRAVRLTTVSGGFWQHLSGPFGQMQVGPGTVTVDMSANTENLQTSLLGAPYEDQ